MDLQQVTDYYKQILTERQTELAHLKKIIFRVGTARLIIILLGAFGCYYLWGNSTYIMIDVLVTILLFLILLQYHNRLFRKKLYCEIQIRDAQSELKALDYDFSAFDGADEKISGEHHFSLDLDLFGNRSFFQSINRTVTSFGRESLAQKLLNPLKDISEIRSVQDAVKELSGKEKYLFHFLTVGKLTAPERLNLKDWDNVFSEKPAFYGNMFWTMLMYLVPALYIVGVVLYGLNIIHGAWFIVIYLITFTLGSFAQKGAGRQLAVFDKTTGILDKYAQLFEIIEKESFDSEVLKDIQLKLSDKSQTASKSIKKLGGFYSNLSMTFTFPLIMFFFPVLFGHVRYARLIEKWSATHREYMKKWFDALGDFDALVSTAIFAYNHPDYIYPEPSKDAFILEGKALGHPLLNRKVCVRNDVNITKKGFFLVITGANMAGKSTYLRTVGINYMLACVGMPVWADSLVFHPQQMITNLRTSDSLADNESYFFAELKRLKMIIDRLQSGEKLFIILDEILKGTNSEDKQKGSMALMKQLISLDSDGIIATHDLLLGTLEKEFPSHIKNYRFEADITNQNLTFTYKMREGVAQNMNACFLMKKMGITGLD